MLRIGSLVVCIKWINKEAGENFLGKIIAVPGKDGGGEYFIVKEIWPHPEVTEYQEAKIRPGNLWLLKNAPPLMIQRVPQKAH